ncbi:MAG: hypothetical protein M0Z80_12995, partial [Treponema sp.]|nr:hypothetical protein [Treponema sp.]
GLVAAGAVAGGPGAVAAGAAVGGPVGSGAVAGRAVDTKAFAAACARDWGLQRTIELSLGKLADWTASTGFDQTGLDPTARAAVLERIEALRAALAEEPKTPAWKLRSLLGARVRWYELPEEPG